MGIAPNRLPHDGILVRSHFVTRRRPHTHIREYSAYVKQRTGQCPPQLTTRLSRFRIREVADKINKYGGHTQPALAGLKVPIKQTVLGPSHIGILLEDGRAYRCAYSIIPERLDLTKNEPMKR